MRRKAIFPHKIPIRNNIFCKWHNITHRGQIYQNRRVKFDPSQPLFLTRFIATVVRKYPGTSHGWIKTFGGLK